MDRNGITPQRDHPARTETALPHEARVAPEAGGWVARLPVRAELLQVGKTVVVYERVTLREQISRTVESLHGQTRREELRIEPRGDVVELGDTHRPHGRAAGAGAEPPRPNEGRRPGTR